MKIMKKLIPLMSLLVLVLLTMPACQQASASISVKGKKVLYVTHFPGHYHDYVAQEKVVQAWAKEAGWDLTVLSVTHKDKGNYSELITKLKKKDYAKGYDAMIYNFCMADSSDLECAHNIMEQTRTNGVPAMLIHCAMHCFWPTYKSGRPNLIPGNKGPAKTSQALVDKWKKAHPGVAFPVWGDFTSIASTRHGAHTPVKMTVADKNHPATQRVLKAFTMQNTELYNNVYLVDGVKALVNGEQTVTRNKKTSTFKAIAMWECPQGKSKIIGISLGHATPDWSNIGFKHLVVDGVNYLIRNPKN
jgi:hypothetical protein